MLPSTLLTSSLLLLFAPAAFAASARTDALISKVKARLAETNLLSWEIGTYTQALLELDAPGYSTLTANSLPLPKSAANSIQPVLQIVKNVISQNRDSSVVGARPIMPDGAAGDPASIGPAVLLADWTKQSGDNTPYRQVVDDQINYLFYNVPKTEDGAISHRVAQLQLWNDNLYMVPPFFAQYGVQYNNKTMIEAAYKQISLYRNYLRDNGLWKHVVLGGSETPVDEGHWATGMGWAAAGMLRVWSTIQKSSFAGQYSSQQNDLIQWTKEVHEAVWRFLPSSRVFNNWVDQNSFPDAAGGTLLAATAYRLSTLAGEHKYVTQAEIIRRSLFNTVESNGAYVHFSDDGWLQPVVNPHSYGQAGEKSAEGNSFVLMLYAAYRDWTAAGSVCSAR